MAKRTNQAEEEDFREPTQGEIDEAEFMSLGGESSLVQIFRLTKEGKRAFCRTVDFGTIQPDLLSWLQAEFGGGRFYCALRQNGRIMRGLTFEIDGPPLVVGQNGKAVDSDGRLLEMFKAQSDNQQNLLAAIIAGNRGPDMGAMMQGLAAMMVAMKPSGPAFDASAVFASMVSVLNSSKGGDELSKFKDFLAIAKDMGLGGGGGEPPDLLTSAVQALPSILAMRQNQPAPAMIAAGQDQPASVAVVENPPKTEAQVDDRIVLLQYLGKKAAANGDVGLYADWLNDEAVTRPAAAFLLQACDQEPWEAIAGFLNQVGITKPEIQDWFKRLYEALKESPEDSETLK